MFFYLSYFFHSLGMVFREPSSLRIKHLWVRDIEDIRFESELHSSKMDSTYKHRVCTELNLIEDNPHEGEGWWEKVAVRGMLGFWIEEKMELTKSLDKNNMCSQMCIYLPKEVLSDIRENHGVIGFKPNNAVPGETPSIVYIHYR